MGDKSAFVGGMKLGKLCILFTDGDWIESKDQSDSGIRLIQTGNIGNGEFLYKNDKAKYISVDTFKRLNCKEVFPNDILVSRLPEPVGRGCIIPDIGEKMITAVDCTICRINENLVDRKYFCYFLESNAYKTQLEQHVTGTTRKRISRKNLSSVEIDIPEQAKQKEVVYKLDRLKKIIQNYNRELDLLDELVRARFVEMFGDNKYEELAVEKVCTSIVDCPHTTPKYNGDLRNPAIRTSEIKKGFITWDTMKYVSDEEYIERTARLKPQQGDIVYGREGTFGNAAILPKGYKFCLGQRVMLLRPNNEFCISQYLLRALISDEVYNQALAKNNASTVAHVNVKDVKNFMIPVPPLELQNQFASFVEEIDKSRSRIQKSLEASQELFDSLMQEYFG